MVAVDARLTRLDCNNFGAAHARGLPSRAWTLPYRSGESVIHESWKAIRLDLINLGNFRDLADLPSGRLSKSSLASLLSKPV